jgi:NADH dehydrogenase
MQPIYVDDLAELAVEQGAGQENVIIDAIGPETITYRELVREVGKAIGTCKPVISVPPLPGYLLGKLVGLLHHDVTITPDEIKGLMAGLLYTGSTPTGRTKLTEWVKDHASEVGTHYHSELKRRTNRVASYERL